MEKACLQQNGDKEPITELFDSILETKETTLKGPEKSTIFLVI